MRVFFRCMYCFLQAIRSRPFCGAMLLCALLLSALIGCEKSDRYKVLTFFFDGVPSLSLEDLDPNSPEYASQVSQLAQVSRTSKHETGENCEHCHKGGILNKPIPNLCYQCHKDYSKQNIYIHGPVVVGDCLFCHRPHESPNKHLLRQPVPDMCFRCHGETAIRLIEGHDNKLYDNCSNCHSGHGSNVKGLLKSDAIVIPKKLLNEAEKAQWDGLINLIRPGQK